ncbi:hypothetical protein C8Q77DRAFT_1064118 [Trametes polyzona]|nr:hypothetical protein C8Q77DRAFT_1064118 [Trametes polyzona]
MTDHSELSHIHLHAQGAIEEDGRGHLLPAKGLLDVLSGVLEATKLTIDPRDVDTLKHWIESHASNQPAVVGPVAAPSLRDWLREAEAALPDDIPRILAKLVLGVAALRQDSRNAQYDGVRILTPTPPPTLELIWNLIRDALTHPSISIRPNRSAQGFLAIPLCNRLNDQKQIEELIRLHVWLPDGQRGNPDVAVHAHQAWARSWVLGGKGTDYDYEVEELGKGAEAEAEAEASATHTLYVLSWDKGRAYKTQQDASCAHNTGVKVRARVSRSQTHRRGDSYVVLSNVPHSSSVAPDELHATLFYFDASRGFAADAPILGPHEGVGFEQRRDPGGYTAAELARIADTLHRYDTLMDESVAHAARADWEPALRAVANAISVCSAPDSAFAEYSERYLSAAVVGLGKIVRRFGRYERAKTILQELLSKARRSQRPVKHLQEEILGELGVVNRHLGILDDARAAFEEQYAIAKELGSERGMCRAIGNLGVVTYLLWHTTGEDHLLLDKAIEQLRERVERARTMKRVLDDVGAIAGDHDTKHRDVHRYEAIGLSRLSLCYAAQDKTEEAIAAARESLDRALDCGDPTVVAISRFFYGRALLGDLRRTEALEQFNGPPETCTPVIAFCKEPCAEYHDYLASLVADADVRLDVVDEQGYSALDYAVFSGDSRAETLVLEGLRRTLSESEVEARRRGAHLRREYRELFQEALRPVLLERGRNGLQRLRQVYAAALEADASKQELFDWLRFVRYQDFKDAGRLPRLSGSDRGRAQAFDPRKVDRGEEVEYIIFMSYVWNHKWTVTPSPDDEEHTRYHRMLSAIDAFLERHPEVDRSKLGIWVDYACVDQDSPAAGVNALPLNLAQCDAVISLVDEKYYTRAWCSVEVLMVQTLRRSWGIHLWYECDQEGKLREGPHDLDVDMRETKLTFEEERPKLRFLERQSRLLGWK